MKKAIIESGGKQYIVSEGDTIEVELMTSSTDKKTISFEPLAIIDGEKSIIGSPLVDKSKVSAEVIDADVKGEKVTAIRYKPKKRVRKIRGHRQRHMILKINKIT